MTEEANATTNDPNPFEEQATRFLRTTEESKRPTCLAFFIAWSGLGVCRAVIGWVAHTKGSAGGKPNVQLHTIVS
jgi:hypothetical protein